AREGVVYHHVNRDRLSEEYFKQLHRRQGGSRILIKDHSYSHIVFDLGRACTQYLYYLKFGNERQRYRNKGRIYHYLGMIAAKRDGSVVHSTKVAAVDQRRLLQ
ncbi:MAG TPA: hypothetical protein VNT76_00690, partial [Candidatus Binatus sp.]|nr:hypothetical protein [Candidatus Binatus sp.]